MTRSTSASTGDWSGIVPSNDADPERMRAAIADFLDAAGFDSPEQPHLADTPARVAATWMEDILQGYELTPAEALGQPFDDPSHELVLVKGIEFSSACPHHLMPYRGTAYVGYVPAGRAVGFSGIVRLLDCLAHRLTLQEWLTRGITSVIDEVLEPQGSACLIDAAPMCVIARGVRRPCDIVSTSFTGIFRSDDTLRRAIFEAAERTSRG
jgi:GTP cyclohydrolase IA